MIRILLSALIVCLCCVAPARAQAPSAAQMLEMVQTMQQLRAPDSATRQRAITRVERSPGGHHPSIVAIAAMALHETGRTEDALRLSYFAEIRLRTDLLLAQQNAPSALIAAMARDTSFLHWFASMDRARFAISAHRRRALVEEAVRLDQRAPRLYSSSLLGPFSTPSETPSADALAIASFRAAAATRARVEDGIVEDAEIATADAAIAAGRPAPEAIILVPEAWRARVRPLRSARLAECEHVQHIAAAPARAAPSAFVVQCTDENLQRDFRALLEPGGQNTFIWLAAESGDEISRHGAAGSWSRHIVARGGRAHLMFHGQGAVLVDAEGAVQTMPTPTAFAPLAVSPSGRYALLASEGLQVLHVETGAITFTQTPTSERTPVNLLTERANGAIELVALHRPAGCAGQSCDMNLVVTDMGTGRHRTVSLPAGVQPYATTLHGPRNVLLSLRPQPQLAPAGDVQTYPDVAAWRAAQERAASERISAPPPQQAILVSLDSFSVVWQGPRADAPSFGAVLCQAGSPTHLAEPIPETRLSLGEAAFALGPAPRRAQYRCAVSGDGTRLVVYADPFLHLYEIAPN